MIYLQVESNLLHCDDRIPPLYQDVAKHLSEAVADSAMAQGMTSFVRFGT
jgi:hypothetical protein